MKVQLIDYTGCGIANDIHREQYAARLLVYTKSTRLTQGEESRRKIMLETPWPEILNELHYMVDTIRSSWEFVDYTFEIQGVSRAFTHQFVRTRTGSYAQQSMRSVDMNGFGYVTPDNIGGNDADNPFATDKEKEWLEIYQDCMATIQASYDELIELGCPIQDARGLLPTNIETNIIAKFNLRTMADLAGKRDNPRAQGEYTKVYKAMAGCVLEVHPWATDFLYPERLQTPAIDRILAELLGKGNPSQNLEINSALKELEKLKSVWG